MNKNIMERKFWLQIISFYIVMFITGFLIAKFML